jgi:shikimate kinase
MTEDSTAISDELQLVQFPPWKLPLKALFLTGFMGAGKTTIGRELASALNSRFFDLDEQIESQAGQTVAQIFSTHGEPHFRHLEHQALERIVCSLTSSALCVVALGGGTIVQPTNSSLLAASESPVVFLDAPVHDLYSRCARVQNRPLLRDQAEFYALYSRRLRFYRQAQVHVATSQKSSSQVAREIISALQIEVPL